MRYYISCFKPQSIVANIVYSSGPTTFTYDFDSRRSTNLKISQITVMRTRIVRVDLKSPKIIPE